MFVLCLVCDVNLDLVFMLDQSGSVGPDNHYIALDFMREVVSYYNISTNSTQVKLKIEFLVLIVKVGI